MSDKEPGMFDKVWDSLKTYTGVQFVITNAPGALEALKSAGSYIGNLDPKVQIGIGAITAALAGGLWMWSKDEDKTAPPEPTPIVQPAEQPSGKK